MLKNIFKSKDIRNRLLFTFVMVLIVRIGSQIPVPTVLNGYFQEWFENQVGDSFSLFDAFTGGSFSSMSIFALGITPYITSSIIIQLLTIAIPKLEEIRKDGETGRKKITAITRITTVALSAVSSIAMAISLGKQGILDDYTILNVIVVAASLTAGTAALVWIGDRITENGIGNGISIVLLTNIVATLPQDISTLFNQFVFTNTIAGGTFAAVIILVVLSALILFSILLCDAERIIPIQNSRKIAGRFVDSGNSLPIKVNTAGVMPVIFASSITQFPVILSSLFGYSGTGIWNEILMYLSSSYWFSTTYPQYSLGVVLYILLIVFFAYFYTHISFNPSELADNLKKRGAMIPGIRPGNPTRDYLAGVLKYIVFIGAVGLSVLCIVMFMLSGFLNISVSFGGTSLIIIVSVIIETTKQVEGALMSQNYKTFL